MYGTASNSALRKLDSIHNAGLRLALGAFCTSPVSSLYTEANETPLEERRLKLSMNYYIKIHANPDNPAYYSMINFDNIRDIYISKPNKRGGMTRPPIPPVGLKMETAMQDAGIYTDDISPMIIPDFPPGTHPYEPHITYLIDDTPKSMISASEAQAKFKEYKLTQGIHDEVYTDGSKMDDKVGAAAIIKHRLSNGEIITRTRSKRLHDNSTVFSAEATAIMLALEYYATQPALNHDVIIYSDSMSCLQDIESEESNHPLTCRLVDLLHRVYDRGTFVRFCWIPSHCGIEGNELVDQKAKDSLNENVNILSKIHYADLKPQVNTYIQNLVQIKWDVEIHGRDLYLIKPELGPPKKYAMSRADEVVITRLRIGHTKANKGHIISREPPNTCNHCGQILTIDHMLLECAALQQTRETYYQVETLKELFEGCYEDVIITYLKEAEFYHLI